MTAVIRYDHPFLEQGTTHVLAHRGSHGTDPSIPGNTSIAFARALERGCDHLETDVQLSRDGQVVVFHDERLEASTTGEGAVADWPWERLQTFRYCSPDGRPTDHGLVRLDTALADFPEAFFNIDVKTDDAVDPVVDLLTRFDVRRRVCVAAFGTRRKWRLRRALKSDWCYAFARNEIAVARIAAWLRLPIPKLGDVVQLPTHWKGIEIVDRTFVDRCHRSGIAVHVWTVNDPAEAHRLYDLGVDAVISDRPELFTASR